MKFTLIILLLVSSLNTHAYIKGAGSGDPDDISRERIAEKEAKEKLAQAEKERQIEKAQNTLNKKREIEARSIEILVKKSQLIYSKDSIIEEINNIENGNVDQNQIIEFKTMISQKLKSASTAQNKEDLEQSDDELFKRK